METFVRGLLADLERACAVVRDRLAADEVAEEVRDHALAAYSEVERIRRAVAELRADPTLGEPALLPAHVRQYRRWRARLMLIESFPLLFIERFAEADRRLTRLASVLTQQISLPVPPPMVAALSTQYYWTEPHFNIICVPVTEGTTLLSLLDLLHELGHIALARHKRILLGSFTQELARYIVTEKRRVDLVQRSPQYHQLYDQLDTQWNGPWLDEFIADMVATYVGGPAFGWQHVRLCAGVNRPTYLPTLEETADHPADEARLRGIVAVLEVLDLRAAAGELAALWSRYLVSTGDSPTTDYDLCYPGSLIESLARHVVAGCQMLGVRPFTQVPSSSQDIIALLGEGWSRFRADPHTYIAWERMALAALWQQIAEP